MSLDNLKKRIKRNEGYSQFPYKDQLGYQTIGYGHLIKKNEKKYFTKTFTKKYFEELFEYDFQKTVDVYKKIFSQNSHNTNERDLLIEMLFQLGPKGVFMNDEQSPGRLIAFLAVSMVILMIWQSLFPPPPPVEVPSPPAHSEKASEAAPSQTQAAANPTAVTPANDVVDTDVTAQPTGQKRPERKVELESDLLRVQFSSYGGRLTAATFQTFREPGTDPERPLIELVPEESLGFGSLEAQGLSPDADYELIRQNPNSVVFRYRLLDGSEIQRRWILDGQSLTHELSIRGEQAGNKRFVFGLEMGNPADSGGGFLFGLLQQRTQFTGCHHGRARVQVNGHGLAGFDFSGVFRNQNGVSKGQNQAGKGQQPSQKDEQIPEPMPGFGLFLNVFEEGNVGKSHPSKPAQLQQMQGNWDGESHQTPQYVRPSPHGANLAPFLAHDTRSAEGVFVGESGVVRSA